MWPRSLKSRLALAFTAAAALVAAAGLGLFVVLLHRGVNASVDSVLQARAARVIAELSARGLPPAPPPPPAEEAAGAGQGSHELDSFTVVYRPDGSVYSAEPATAARMLKGSHEIVEARGASGHLTITDGEEPLRLLARPVDRAGGTWVVAVGTSLKPASSAADRAASDLLVAVPILIALAGVGAWLLAAASLRPVERMRSDAGRLNEGDLSGRINVPAETAELARLATTFNALLDRAQTSLERQRKLVADTGHELRTPLAVLRTELELADSPHSTRADLADAISHARREAERLSRLADDMLFLARADSDSPLVHLQPMDLCPVLDDAVRAHRARAAGSKVDLSCTCPGPLWVRGDAEAVRRAVDNLVGNSLAVTPPSGRVQVCAEQSGPEVVVEVRDSGPGFQPDFLPHAFDRFTRAEAARSSGRHGAGLGLAIVAEIAAAHGGQAAACNPPGGGAAVTMTLVPADEVPSEAGRQVGDPATG